MKYIAKLTENCCIKGKIRFCCETLDVSRQGFYDYLRRKKRTLNYEQLAEEIMSKITIENVCKSYREMCRANYIFRPRESAHR